MRQFVWAKQSPELAVNKAKYVKEITHIAILPENFKPSKVPSQQGRRLIFIGDVHGAYDELVELLAKAKYTSMTGGYIAVSTSNLEIILYSLGIWYPKGRILPRSSSSP